MTNAEKFTTPEERFKEFDAFCRERFHKCHDGCPLSRGHLEAKNGYYCPFAWLDLEAEDEETLPCPFCGGTTKPYRICNHEDYFVFCVRKGCGYSSGFKNNLRDAIDEHNRICKASAVSKMEGLE